MMKFKELNLEGVFLVKNFAARDNRGIFVKTFHQDVFQEIGFNGVFKESYYSQSSKGVIRGMHFQMPPAAHKKLVYVTDGEIVDVIVDLRKASPTFRQFTSVKLRAFENSIFIPKGCAHGFLTVSDVATVVYNVTTVYQPDVDTGIRFNSFGFDWEESKPILSSRDASFVSLDEFVSPF